MRLIGRRPWAYYNEINPFTAAWLRELMKNGVIAEGEVDERSIVEVTPVEVRDFCQCHWFAGIAVWPYALRLAGWPDNRPVWTGSCPCQPFSQGGKRGGFTDERHLWPAWFHLISQCDPVTIFGEQVASKDGLAWFDLVQADLAGASYACGVTDTCSAGFGAPHIRQRLYWLAHNIGIRWGGRVHGRDQGENRKISPEDQTPGSMLTGRVGNSGRPGKTNGFWENVDWLFCQDGKWRPTQSISEQMDDGLADSLGYICFDGLFSLNPIKERKKEDMKILHGYGNALNAKQAEWHIRAAMDILSRLSVGGY